MNKQPCMQPCAIATTKNCHSIICGINSYGLIFLYYTLCSLGRIAPSGSARPWVSVSALVSVCPLIFICWHNAALCIDDSWPAFHIQMLAPRVKPERISLVWQDPNPQRHARKCMSMKSATRAWGVAPHKATSVKVNDWWWQQGSHSTS